PRSTLLASSAASDVYKRQEWQYKNGLDGEPAVGVSLQVLEPASGRVLWSTSGARAGWSRESLAGAAQKVLRELVGDLRLE
ncbi:hypothetical protein FCG81_18730, partial [Pseudomonas aeruginosa]|nr:hypothetical protein [Pseudomonas aeruginosa]